MSIGSDSLLSNISNISVMIKPNDGSSIFNLSFIQNHNDREQSEKLHEVKIEDIFPFDSHMQDNNSIFDKIMRKEDKESSIMHFCQTPQLPQSPYNNNFNEKTWAITHLKGVSEDEQSPQDEEQSDINEKKLKNETKNIPKNYGKAIITFI
jgi:hypothetical protein